MGGWKSGWIPIVDDRHPERGQLLHRPLPGFPGYTMCGELVADPSALQRRRPAGIDQCRACAIVSRNTRPAPAPARTRSPDRWRTGWVVQLHDGDRPFAHRPNPDDPAAFMCGLAVPAEHELLTARPDGMNECGRCALFISRARKKARKDDAKRHHDPLRSLPRPADPEQIDRRDRSRQRGTSVRTVTGGLPTLGKRH